jgi:hypothetical protein
MALVRNYIRQGYEIKGRVGWSDCCCSCWFFPCVATQLLNEVESRGPRLISVENEVDGPCKFLLFY